MSSLPISVTTFFLALFVFSELLSSTAAYDFSLSKRDASSSPPPPATLFMPLNFDGQRYTVNISLVNSGSSQEQSFAFALTTSTGYSTVASQGCSTCGGSPTFSVPSSDSISSGSVQNVSLFDSGVSGPVIQQTCKLQLQNGSSWSWTDEAFIVANQSNSIFTPDISGVLGLGTNSRQGLFNETPMGFWLKNNPSHQNFSYGLALNSPSDSSSNGGMLHWLAYDEESFEGDISWKSLIASNSSSSSANADSMVEMDSWAFSSGNGASSHSGNLPTIVDPYFADIVFPQSQAQSIYDSIPGSQQQTTNEGIGSITYSLPCDTTMQLTLTFGNVSATLTEAQLVQNLGNTTCIGILQGWAAEDASAFLLGSSVISNIYLIYQGSNSGSSYGFANKRTTSSTTLNGASIAGVVLGSLALLIMAIIAAVLLYRWRRRRARKDVQAYPYLIENMSRPPSATSPQSFFTPNDLSRFTQPPITPPSRSTNYRSGISGGSSGESNKRNERMMEQLRNTISIYNAYRSSTQSRFTRNTQSQSQGESSPGLLIQVAPPSPRTAAYTVEGGDIESGPLLRYSGSMKSVATLPPYAPRESNQNTNLRYYI